MKNFTDDVFLKKLKDYIITNTGLEYYQDKDADLALKIHNRMKQNHIIEYFEYYDLLNDSAKGKTEFYELVSTLTIGETYFFRNKEVFQVLKEKIFSELIKQNRDIKKLHIWSAGCASGEEAYTLSILLRNEFLSELHDWDISIIGTDINRKSIAQALEGKYRDWSFRETSEEIKKDCFIQDKEYYFIKPEYKKNVTFQYHNLVENDFPSLTHNLMAFDLILCRNVMIYFHPELIEKLIKKFELSLKENSWLIIGHAEHNIPALKKSFKLYYSQAFSYKKTTEEAIQDDYIPKIVKKETNTFEEEINNIMQQIESIPIPNIITENKPDFNLLIEDKLIHFKTLLDQGKWDEALAYSNILQQNDKLNPLVYFYHALLLIQEGHYNDAEKALKKSIYLDKNFILGHYHIALIYQNTGKFSNAKKSFENTINLLNNLNEDYIFTYADNIKVKELKELTKFNLEIIEKL